MLKRANNFEESYFLQEKIIVVQPNSLDDVKRESRFFIIRLDSKYFDCTYGLEFINIGMLLICYLLVLKCE